jgi:hypothetical protein
MLENSPEPDASTSGVGVGAGFTAAELRRSSASTSA